MQVASHEHFAMRKSTTECNIVGLKSIKSSRNEYVSRRAHTHSQSQNQQPFQVYSNADASICILHLAVFQTISTQIRTVFAFFVG